jgi:hypothetical protein
MNPQDANSFRSICLKEKPFIALVIFMSVLYSVLSIIRHWHFASNGWNPGLFGQIETGF